MKQYECDLCGYVYDEVAGDPTTASPPAPSGRTCPPTGCAPVRRRKGQSSPLSEKKSASNGRGTSLEVASDAGRGYPALQCGDSGAKGSRSPE